MRIDVYCRVVDNYGDAGICWRLARQLVSEFSVQLRLVTDQPVLLAQIALGNSPYAHELTRTALPWPVDQVLIYDWAQSDLLTGPPDVVIAAFQCELPDQLRARLTQRGDDTALWINLDYLSAERWVNDAHGQPSYKPSGGIEWFFMPGFDSGSGGLLRERQIGVSPACGADSIAAPAPHNSSPGWLPRPSASAFRITLFSYPHAPNAALFAALDQGAALSPAVTIPVHILVAATLGAALGARTGPQPAGSGGSALEPLSANGRTLHQLPWLSQPDFDRLLALCDLNFVRGEDSWIRAIWAGKPFVWLPYPQSQQLHETKLEAFLARLEPCFEPRAFDATAQLMRAWNQPSGRNDSGLAPALSAFLADYRAIAIGFRQFAAQQSAQTDLANRLIQFIYSRRPLLQSRVLQINLP